MRVMKNIRNLLILVCLLAWSMPVPAQSNTASKSPASAPSVKNKKAPAETKQPSPGEFANTGNDQQLNYTTVDGRKVQVDNQGVQSLAVPKPIPATQQPEAKTKTPKK